MVGDMFNARLKSKLDALCSDIVAHLDASEAVGAVASKPEEVSYRSEAASQQRRLPAIRPLDEAPASLPPPIQQGNHSIDGISHSWTQSGCGASLIC
jgi:hypothetical protein